MEHGTWGMGHGSWVRIDARESIWLFSSKVPMQRTSIFGGVLFRCFGSSNGTLVDWSTRAPPTQSKRNMQPDRPSASCQLPLTCQLPTANCQLPTANCHIQNSTLEIVQAFGLR